MGNVISTVEKMCEKNLFDWISDVRRALGIYYIPILVSFGTIDNGLSICVFFSSEFRKKTSSYYLGALAICDTGFLISIFVYCLALFHGFRLGYQPGFCQFFIFLSKLCRCLSAWFILAFTVERLVAVCYPLRRKFMCTVVRRIKRFFIIYNNWFSRIVWEITFLMKFSHFLCHWLNSRRYKLLTKVSILYRKNF